MFCRGGGGEPTRCARPGRGLVLPHPAEAEPGFPHVVRIRTDTFLCPEKCPGCRVRWGRNRAEYLPQNQPSLGPGGAGERGSLALGRPRPCPPPHAAFRTRCTRTVQRVRSEAHYAAAGPRLARLASGGRSGETGEPPRLPPAPGPAARGHHPSFASEAMPRARVHAPGRTQKRRQA